MAVTVCRTLLPALLVAAAALALACGGAAPDAPPGRRPHVVLVVIDTLRADALGFQGSPHASPHLDRLAGESIVFTQAIAPSTWTLPSMASLVTSLYPSEHGLLGGGDGDDRLPEVLGEEHVTLAEVFQGGGYSTLGVVNQVFLSWKYGFGQGFDQYAAVRGFDGLRINRRLERELAALGAARATEDAVDAPLFLYVHYLDPHWPYRHRMDEDRAALPASLQAADHDLGLPREADQVSAWVAKQDPELRRRAVDTLAARYALEVRWIDAAIAGLIDLLQQRGLWDDAIFVVTSDHGEGFWEHERLLHGHSPHEEQIRIPLLVRTPPALGFPAGTRAAPVSLIDLMPTLLDLAGLPIPDHCRGRSLVAAMRGEEDGERALLIETGWERALRTRDAKLLVRGVGVGRHSGDGGDVTLEYYDLVADPGERHNLATPCAGPCRDSVRRLQEIERALVPAVRAAGDASGDVTPDEIEELRSLGYIGD